MAEVTNELLYEVLKAVQDKLTTFDRKLDELKAELQAVRIHSIATQQDIQNIYATLARQEGRVERIERRLELSEGEFAR
jgi:chromosome segregation ATPase